MPPLRAISKVAFLVQRVPPAKSVMLTFITFLGQNGTCQNSFDTNAGPGLVFYYIIQTLSGFHIEHY